MNFSSRRGHLALPVFCVALVLAFLAVLTTLGIASGQTLSDPWAPPVNVSSSGAATDPVVFQAVDGSTLVLWQDELAGFVFTRLAGSPQDPAAWSAPVAATLPFTGTRPHLLSGNGTDIVAFWIGAPSGDNPDNLTDTLQQSRVAAGDFANLAAWAAPQTLAEAVVAVDVVRGGDGRLHLFYLGANDADSTVAGLYYRQSGDGGISWSEPALLYESGYLRPGIADGAQVAATIATVEAAERFLVTWDNPSLERVFVRVSPDAGGSWANLVEIDRREVTDASGATGPGKPSIAADGTDALVVWQAGHELAACGLYYANSSDAGDTWQARQPVPLGSALCPEEHVLLGYLENQALLMTSDARLTSLTAWNGVAWSLRQDQETLTGFTNPETFRELDFSCYQPLLGPDSLTMVGCSTEGLKDVWLTTRPLVNLAAWYERPTAWTDVEEVYDGASSFVSYDVAGDQNGTVHVAWTTEESSAVFYTRKHDGAWSTPAAVVSSPGGQPGSLSLAVTEDGRLLMVWDDSDGGIYFSQAGVEQTVFSSRWSPPERLPGTQREASFPVAIGGNPNEIFVAYSVPLNEERGIYLSRSMDEGQAWTAPQLLFDGAAAAWPVVGPAQIARTDDGVLHLMWSRHTTALGGTGAATALSYARSTDNGESLADQESILDGDVAWHALYSAGEDVVHRLSLRKTSGAPEFTHEMSANSGQTWESVQRLANLAGELSAIVDGNGVMHLVQFTDGGFYHWQFAGERWERSDSLVPVAGASLPQLAVGGRTLSTVFATPAGSNAGGRMGLMATQLVLDDEETVPVVVPPEPAEQAVALEEADLLPVAEAESTTPFVDVPDDTGRGPAFLANLATGGATSRLLLGIVPAALLVILVVAGVVVAVRGADWFGGRRS